MICILHSLKRLLCILTGEIKTFYFYLFIFSLEARNLVCLHFWFTNMAATNGC